GSRIRITAQLILAEDGTHLWSQRYDREMTDVFAIQDEIFAAIVQELRLNLTCQSLAKRAHVNLAAYEATLEGRHHLLKFDPVAIDRARQCLERALDVDPLYAAAHAGLAQYHIFHSALGLSDPRQGLRLAEKSVLRALELDPASPEAHATAGQVRAELYY